MAEQSITPKYAHLEYQVLHDLEISIAEYFFLDMIYRLSHGIGWGNKKIENIAKDMRITKRGVMKMRDRLIERELLIKGVGSRLRTSEKVNKVYFSDESRVTKSELSSKKVNKVHPKSEQSITKTSVENNTKNNKELGNLFNSNGTMTLAARERALGVTKPRV